MAEPFSLKGMQFQGKVSRVVDGDTMRIVFSICEHFGPREFNCRIMHIDTPEMRKHGQLAQMAKEAAYNFVWDKPVTVVCDTFDNFGRLLCEVKVDSLDLADHLVELRLAKRYEGKHKKSFDDLFEYHGIMQR